VSLVRSSMLHGSPSPATAAARAWAVSLARARIGVIQRTVKGSLVLRLAARAESRLERRSITGPPKTASVLPLPVGA
jgi:hypothetical protein